jgi:hypothetical protein
MDELSKMYFNTIIKMIKENKTTKELIQDLKKTKTKTKNNKKNETSNRKTR